MAATKLSDFSSHKIVAITGGATGIGRASVVKFVQEGYGVSFCDINDVEAKQLLADPKVSEAYSKGLVIYCHVDTKDRSQLKSWAIKTLEHFGHIDAVFANAGIHRSNTLLDISEEELKLMIDTNIYGTIYTLKETIPLLIKNGGGSIVINDSDQFFIGKAHSFGYGLTKGALGQITRSLSIDLGPQKIRVNAVCAGTIHTPLADRALGNYAAKAGITLEEAWAEEDKLYALGKSGTAEEVAEMVFFLTDKATFCTGAHYLVDGGLVAHS